MTNRRRLSLSAFALVVAAAMNLSTPRALPARTVTDCGPQDGPPPMDSAICIIWCIQNGFSDGYIYCHITDPEEGEWWCQCV